MDHGKVIADGTVDHVIASAGVTGRGQLRVSLDDIGAAVAALEDLPAAKWLNFDNSRTGDIEIELSSDAGARRTILSRLLDSGIEPRSFDLQGARLSDASLALTGSERELVT
jgi:hypothetical protein